MFVTLSKEELRKCVHEGRADSSADSLRENCGTALAKQQSAVEIALISLPWTTYARNCLMRIRLAALRLRCSTYRYIRQTPIWSTKIMLRPRIASKRISCAVWTVLEHAFRRQVAFICILETGGPFCIPTISLINTSRVLRKPKDIYHVNAALPEIIYWYIYVTKKFFELHLIIQDCLICRLAIAFVLY